MIVWFQAQRRDWTYDINARGVAAALADRYEIRVVYSNDDIHAGPDDVVLDFWWKGNAQHPRLIRQVSSHRWAQRHHGRLSADLLVTRQLTEARVVTVPSVRLEREIGAIRPVMRTPKGFDPALFYDRGGRTGDLSVGWAGTPKPDKGLWFLRPACADLRMACSLPYAEMPTFYAGLDVIACASEAEGDPRTLIEGMACGCFPVTVDVGIVPELVRHGDNGLIVERSVEAFAAAFDWCRSNLGHVRAAGRRNAEQMRATRTWAHVAPAWAAAIAHAAQ